MRSSLSRVTAGAAAGALLLLAAACAAKDAGTPRAAQAGPASSRPPLQYVSLGDSYSAGGGLAGVRPCGRSPQAYPALVAQRAHVVVSEHACNGATTADVLDTEQVAGVGKQIDAVGADTGVVTITIGGNDIGFADVMRRCALGSEPCTNLEGQVDRDLAALPAKLLAVYREIRRRAPNAALLVVGYPQLVVDPAASGLPACAGLTADESRFVRRKGDDLARVVRTAAEASGARYVDAAAAFAGHEACAAEPWMEGVNFVNIVGSYHPNAAGQDHLAQLVQAALPNP